MPHINDAYKKGTPELKGLSPLMATRPTFLDGAKTAGLRDYELIDHLSNVMVVISDRKLSVDTNNDTITDYYAPQVVSFTDYYPFGFPMAERSGNLSGYRFGFNGQEADGEVYGEKQSYTAEFWQYDTRLGRRWNLDPKGGISVSPYACFNNNPILYNDPTGESGEVTIDKESKTITVTSNIVLYGGKASAELAKSTANDIQKSWNDAAGKVTIDGTEYSVKFVVTGEYRSDLTPDEVAKNTDIKQNYIRVEETTDLSTQGSYMDDAPSNTGYWKYSEVSGEGSTTEPHEWGHGAGEEHPARDKTGNIDYRGKGAPRMMLPRGSLVDAKYQWDPKAKAGEKGGTMNPKYRKVTQTDIDELKLDKLTYDKSGKANLGKTTNIYHKK